MLFPTIHDCQVQRNARALSEHTPGVEPVSDRRKWQKAEPADSKEAAYCGRQKHRSYGHERLFGPRRVLSDRRERDLHICSLRFI